MSRVGRDRAPLELRDHPRPALGQHPARPRRRSSRSTRPPVQRLRYVRQVGHAFLVYPGATHTRFEHALGAYHLTKRALAALEERGELGRVPERTASRSGWRRCCTTSDTIRSPTRSRKRASPPTRPSASPSCGQGELGERLREIGGPGFAGKVGALITGESDEPAAGPDLRLARPRQDRLPEPGRPHVRRAVRHRGRGPAALHAHAWWTAATGRPEVGVQEKGVSALESLLFAKYQMYRNVYWHHAVRARHLHVQARRAGRGRRGAASPSRAIAEATDDGLMEVLITRDRNPLAGAIRARRLTSGRSTCRRATCRGDVQPWVAEDPDAAGAGRGRPGGAGRARARRAAARLPRALVDARASTCRSAPAAAPSSGSPTRAARASWACPGSPTSSTGARAGSGCSWPPRRPARSTDCWTC